MSNTLRNTALVVATAASLGLAAMTAPAQAGGLSTSLENDSSVVWTSFADKAQRDLSVGPPRRPLRHSRSQVSLFDPSAGRLFQKRPAGFLLRAARPTVMAAMRPRRCPEHTRPA